MLTSHYACATLFFLSDCGYKLIKLDKYFRKSLNVDIDIISD